MMRMANAPYLARLEMLVFIPTVFCGCLVAYAIRALYQEPSLTMIMAASKAAKAKKEIEC